MATDKESPFIRGIQDRLDTIFGEDKKKPVHEEGTEPPKEDATGSESAGVRGDDGTKVSQIGYVKDQDKTPFVRGVESRLDAIFGEYEKQPDQKMSALETTLSGEKDDKAERFEQIFGELVTSTSIMYSPLKDLKSAVLSIEWEVTEQTTEKFDREVSKLSDLFAEDKIILGFLKILRFLGRYMSVKGVDTHYVSVKLLMSVYDNLEKALLTKDISDAQKHELLCEEVKKYREWVHTVDLTVKEDEAESKEARVGGEPAVSSRQQKELPRDRAVRAVMEATPAAGGMEMTPHEAFAFALEEIKKVISAEFSALRAELKLWRQDK